MNKNKEDRNNKLVEVTTNLLNEYYNENREVGGYPSTQVRSNTIDTLLWVLEKLNKI
jgi:hypothetical protein